jgi:hypothetical protein
MGLHYRMVDGATSMEPGKSRTGIMFGLGQEAGEKQQDKPGAQRSGAPDIVARVAQGIRGSAALRPRLVS